MNPTNANIICLSGSNPLSHTNQLVWWGLLVIEALLFIRFFQELFAAHPTNGLVSLVNASTNFIAYPFTATLLSDSSGEGLIEWVLMITVIVYFLLAIGVARMIEVSRPARSRIERARAFSRRRYNF